MLEATLLRRRLFIVLMTAAHISPNVFSLQLSLAGVYWASYYNIQQCIHTYYTSHSHNLILYYIILHDTLTSILHLHFFCSSWQAGCSRLIVSDTVITKIFNSCKYWTVMIQPYVKTISNSVFALLVASLLFDFCLYGFLFV
jgi:hypothetical protein